MQKTFDNNLSVGEVGRRPAEKVMRLSRLGSFHQSRLSFLRILLRRISTEKWKFQKRENEKPTRSINETKKNENVDPPVSPFKK